MASERDAEFAAILAEVRAKHHPYFADLEAHVRHVHPDFDEYEVASFVCSVVDLADMETDEILANANPGIERTQ